MYTGNLLTFLEEGKMHPSGCFAANSSLTIFQMSLGLSLGFSFAASLHLMLKEMVQSRMPSALGLSDMFSGGHRAYHSTLGNVCQSLQKCPFRSPPTS